jgi:hypothetical protein
MTCCPKNRAKLAGSVYMELLLLTIKGHKRSFQLYMKWNKPRVSTAGTDIRRTRLR